LPFSVYQSIDIMSSRYKITTIKRYHVWYVTLFNSIKNWFISYFYRYFLNRHRTKLLQVPLIVPFISFYALEQEQALWRKRKAFLIANIIILFSKKRCPIWLFLNYNSSVHQRWIGTYYNIIRETNSTSLVLRLPGLGYEILSRSMLSKRHLIHKKIYEKKTDTKFIVIIICGNIFHLGVNFDGKCWLFISRQ